MERANKVLRSQKKISFNRHLDIDYLKDNCLVLFLYLSGKDITNIDYAKGADPLGYRDLELLGADVLSLFPKKYADLHRGGHIFNRFMLANDTNKLQKRTGMSYLLDA
jgi:hypothetical protein